MKSHWVRHNSRRVLIADFSGFAGNAAGLQTEIENVKELLKQEMPNSVLAITYVEGTFANPEVIKVFSGLLPFSNKYVCKRAMVGLDGFRKYFLESMSTLTGNVHFKLFSSLEVALDWITTD